MPSQKTGIDTPASAMVFAVQSIHRPRSDAAATPAAIPIGMARRSAKSASSAVAANRSQRSGAIRRSST
jgi:hypothetical protein